MTDPYSRDFIRDTHFLGFTELLFDELVDGANLVQVHGWTLEITGKMKEIITRRAYDLVEHAVEHLSLDAQESPAYKQELLQEIPDLTEWPPTTVE